MSTPVRQQYGKYRLLQQLGQGGQAAVYLGEHMLLGTQAAIKVLHTSMAQAEEAHFRREAQMIAQFDHPHIVRVLDFDVQAGVPFLVMSYAKEGTLRTRHALGTCVPLATVVTYVNQIADALQYAHARQVVHCDLKPENLLLGSRGDLLLSDFGIALLLHTSVLQKTQQVAGTAAYMAPEQFRGHPCLASDQYALAVLVYEWLCGERLFQGSFAHVAGGHLYRTPPSLHQKNPAVSREVEQVVLKALAKAPQARFESVHDFAVALECASTRSLSALTSRTPSESLVDGVTETVLALPASKTNSPTRTSSPIEEQHLRCQVRGSGLTKTVCGGLVGVSVFLWLVTGAIPSLHTFFALAILLCLVFWIAAYADHEQATKLSLKREKQ